MSKEIPFDEDVMTLIMGIKPDEPGQHGRTTVPVPTKDAVGVITQIKQLCEDFLEACGEKCDDKQPDWEDAEKGDEKDMEEDSEDK